MDILHYYLHFFIDPPRGLSTDPTPLFLSTQLLNVPRKGFFSQAMHTVSFDWFLSGLEWILNFDILSEIIMEYQI